jgi:sec-independent protein translocase protein TatA
LAPILKEATEKEMTVFAHWWELALVLILALVFFGPKRLPEIGGAMGKGIKEFKKATTESDDNATANDTPEQPRQIHAAAQQTEPQPKDRTEAR